MPAFEGLPQRTVAVSIERVERGTVETEPFHHGREAPLDGQLQRSPPVRPCHALNIRLLIDEEESGHHVLPLDGLLS